MYRILALLLAVVVIACGGDDGSPTPTPMPTAEPAIAPAAAATSVAQPATLTVQRIPVRWVAEPTPFDIANAGNPDAPFVERAAELRQGNRDNGPDEWQVGLVEGNAAPRIVHSSRKGLLSLTWAASGLQASLITERPVPSSVLGVSKAFRWQGSVAIDVRSGQVTERLNPFPDSVSTTVEGTPLAVSLTSSASDPAMVVTFTRPSALSGTPSAPVFSPPATLSTHFLDAQGTSRRLEGLPDVQTLAPLPNGRAFLGGPDRAGRVYFVPPQDGDALLVTSVTGFAVEGVFDSTANPPRANGSRVFLALNAGPTGTYVIYDSVSHSLREIGRGEWPGPSVHGTWSEAGRVQAGEELIDVNTGRREPVQRAPGSSLPFNAQAVVSPDKRYTLHLTPPAQLDPPGDCAGLPLRVELEQSGKRSTVFECPGGYPSSARWLDNTHALVSTTICRGGCDDPKSGLMLVDAANARAVPLTSDWVEGPYALPSPDGTRLLVGGNAREERGIDGALLRRIEPPPLRRISTAVWSPDGSSFAYIVAPSGWYFFGP